MHICCIATFNARFYSLGVGATVDQVQKSIDTLKLDQGNDGVRLEGNAFMSYVFEIIQSTVHDSDFRRVFTFMLP